MHFVRHTQFSEVGLGILIVFSTALTVNLAAETQAPRHPNVQATRPSVKNYGDLPVAFEPNVGQTDKRVRFMTRTGGMTSFFTDTETVMVLSRARSERKSEPGRDVDAAGIARQAVVRMKLENASPWRRPVGLEKLPGVSNYFIGN